MELTGARIEPLPRASWPVIGIFILLVVAGAAYARPFLMPVVLAFLLALVFSPVRRFLARWRIRSGLSALLIVSMLVALLMTGLVLLSAPVARWIENAPTIGQEIEQKLSSLRNSFENVAEVGEQVDQITSAGDEQKAQEVVVREEGWAAAVATIAPAVLAQIVFTLALLLFLLASGDMFYEKIVHSLPTFKDKRRAMEIAFDVERKLSRYLFTITLINASLGMAIGVAMWLIGMPNPLLFGVTGFVFNFIPYFGALAGVVLATLVGLVTFDEAGQAFLAGLLYLVLTASEGQFVTPYFVGQRLKLNTVVVFLSVAFWAWLWSVVGMLVAVPLLVTVRTFCEHIPQLHGLGYFLSARDAEPPKDDEESSA
jgi:predicted PurR-regulated permease PerM